MRVPGSGVDELVRVGLAGGQDGHRRDPRPRRRTGRAAWVARSSGDPRDRIPGRRSRRSGDDLASQDTFSRSRPRRDGMGRGSGWRGSSGPRRCVLSPARVDPGLRNASPGDITNLTPPGLAPGSSGAGTRRVPGRVPDPPGAETRTSSSRPLMRADAIPPVGGDSQRVGLGRRRSTSHQESRLESP